MTEQALEAVLAHLLKTGPLLILFTWAMTLLGAGLAYRGQVPQPERRLRGFLGFCFPAAVLKHRSVRTDLFFAATIKLVQPLAIAPLLIGHAAAAGIAYAGLTALFGERPQVAAPVWAWVLLLPILLLVQDFMTFYVHYVMHVIRPLWEVHKVHHSAEVLVPITNRRFHPIQVVLDIAAQTAAIGLVIGCLAYAFALPLVDLTIAGIDVYYLLNALSFHHLRHSHIPLSYGRLERWLLSPAQHQIHHSAERQHWDRNFGLFLSCWDRLFGTIVYAKPGETFRLGLAEGGRDYDSVLKLWVTPLRRVACWTVEALRLRGRGRSPAGALPEQG